MWGALNQHNSHTAMIYLVVLLVLVLVLVLGLGLGLKRGKQDAPKQERAKGRKISLIFHCILQTVMNGMS
jgi:hypothetical protein